MGAAILVRSAWNFMQSYYYLHRFNNEQKYYLLLFFVCNHLTRRPCWWSIQKKFFCKICIKIEFISQRRATLLFLTTNMAAVTSLANKQFALVLSQTMFTDLEVILDPLDILLGVRKKDYTTLRVPTILARIVVD